MKRFNILVLTLVVMLLSFTRNTQALMATVVAQSNGVDYASVQEALVNSKNGATIKLLSDSISTEKLVVTENKEITFDLNGFKLSFTGKVDPSISIDKSSTLNVLDSSNDKTGGIYNDSQYSDIFRNNGRLIIQSGTFGDLSHNNYAVFMGNGNSETIVEGGTINGFIYSNGTHSGQQLKINGGTFNSNLYLASKNSTTTITGGVFTPHSNLSAIEIDAGKLTITGGSFENNIATQNTNSTITNTSASGGYAGVIVAVKPTSSALNAYGSDIQLEITGGTFRNTLGDVIVLANQAKSSIVGVTQIKAIIDEGLFGASNISVYDRSDLATSDKTNVTMRMIDVVRIGQKPYYSLSDALNAANDGDTLRLNKSISDASSITISGKKLTLDLNGKTIDFKSGTSNNIRVNADGDLTINDSSSSQTGSIQNPTDLAILFRNFGNLTINGGTYGTLNTRSYSLVLGDGKSLTTVNGGVFNGYTTSNGSQSGQSLVINGGSFNRQLYLASKDTTTVINGGNFDPHGMISAIEIDAGSLTINGGKFTNNTNSSDNINAITNNNGSGSLRGVIVAVKPSGTSVNGYGSQIEVAINGGDFTNNLGDILVLANRATASLPGITKIYATVKNDVISSSKIGVYDSNKVEPLYNSELKEMYRVDYAITKDGLSTIIKTEYYESGQIISNAELPTFDGYESNGWNLVGQQVVSNTTVNAQYVPKSYVVKFYDLAGEIISSQIVKHGKSAVSPSLKEMAKHIFIGWDRSFASITASQDIKPYYSLIPQSNIKQTQLQSLEVSGLSGAVSFTPEELNQGAYAKIDIAPLSIDILDTKEQKLLADFFVNNLKTKNPTLVLLDISLSKVVGQTTNDVAEADGKISISFSLPSIFKDKAFNVIRIHDGVVEVLEHSVDPLSGTVTFETDKFSTYGVVSAASPMQQQLPETGMASVIPVASSIALAGFLMLLISKRRESRNI